MWGGNYRSAMPHQAVHYSVGRRTVLSFLSIEKMVKYRPIYVNVPSPALINYIYIM